MDIREYFGLSLTFSAPERDRPSIQHNLEYQYVLYGGGSPFFGL